MPTRSFAPSSQYQAKLFAVLTLVAVAILVVGAFFGWLISLDEGPRAGRNVAVGVMLVNLLWWLTAMALATPYVRSLRYELREDEVIVHVGIWTKSVKHVPFRTVTNITIKRDILDRWFFRIGTLNIQTAGMSGTKGAEEKLVGLPNVHEVYEIVAGELRRFRGGMSPTATESEVSGISDVSQLLGAMLEELRAIRDALSRES